jgi:hypothetical protein
MTHDDVLALEDLRQVLADDGDLVDFTDDALRATIADPETRRGRRMWARLILGSRRDPADDRRRRRPSSDAPGAPVKQGSLLETT